MLKAGDVDMKYTKPKLKVLELHRAKGVECGSGSNPVGTCDPVGATATACTPYGANAVVCLVGYLV